MALTGQQKAIMYFLTSKIVALGESRSEDYWDCNLML